MSRSEEALAPARADLPSGTVTFVFTDIEGSTKLAHGLGTERWGEVLAQHASAIRAAYRAHRGVEVRTEGDSFFLAFEAARHAVGFAAEAQRALAATRWKHDAPVRVRMGMHTGEGARPGTVADASDYVGYEVHLAARVAAAPRGGQVVISAATAQLTGDQLPPGVALRDLGEHQLKDITQPIRLYQLVVDGLPSDFPALRTLSAVANNLPVQLTSFVGRQSELETARGLLERTRLVTLVGPGGTGKTRLAIEVGSSVLGRSPDGVWFVDLSPLSARDQAVRAIASAVGLMETRPALGAAPAPPAEQPLEALTRSLADRELLLILDNCEHLVEACASIAHTLLTAGPRLRVLATSREPLNISGETVLRLPPLTVPAARANGGAAESEAVKLFAERASRVRPGFALTEENLPAVAQITRRLDGLPLAIELAAARVKVLTPQEIAGRLDDAFKLLGSGSRGGTQRHQTLRATIDWSYELLEERERVLFRRLAVFVGGFDHAAAEFVAAGDGLDAFEVLDALEVLVDRSLVLAEYAGAGSRFGMLQTMAQYAQEKLAEAGKTASVRGRHLSWCLDLAEKAEHGLEGSEQLEWLERLDRDRENIRAALEWAESDPALCARALFDSGERWAATGICAISWPRVGSGSSACSCVRRALRWTPGGAPSSGRRGSRRWPLTYRRRRRWARARRPPRASGVTRRRCRDRSPCSRSSRTSPGSLGARASCGRRASPAHAGSPTTGRSADRCTGSGCSRRARETASALDRFLARASRPHVGSGIRVRSRWRTSRWGRSRASPGICQAQVTLSRPASRCAASWGGTAARRPHSTSSHWWPPRPAT
ncbi:MAG: adenylate/guanylate cyclase domain-containing protein [Candidatus Limnocylindria bacterium]